MKNILTSPSKPFNDKFLVKVNDDQNQVDFSNSFRLSIHSYESIYTNYYEIEMGPPGDYFTNIPLLSATMYSTEGKSFAFNEYNTILKISVCDSIIKGYYFYGSTKKLVYKILDVSKEDGYETVCIYRKNIDDIPSFQVDKVYINFRWNWFCC